MTTTALGLPGFRHESDSVPELMPETGPLVDTFGRVATDLRVSVTDRCNLRCTYCMPAEGLEWLPGDNLLSPDELTRLLRLAVTRLGITSIRFTGGEPLLQKNSRPLMQQLCDAGFTVLIETSGAHDISKIDPRVHRIMDLKCPASGEVERNLFSNLAHLKATDEIKFVIGTQEDYDWAKQQIDAHKLDALCPLLFSWVHPLAPEQQSKVLKKVPAGLTPISRKALAEKIIADALPVRFQIQQHKIIWPPEQRGV